MLAAMIAGVTMVFGGEENGRGRCVEGRCVVRGVGKLWRGGGSGERGREGRGGEGGGPRAAT